MPFAYPGEFDGIRNHAQRFLVFDATNGVHLLVVEEFIDLLLPIVASDPQPPALREKLVAANEPLAFTWKLLVKGVLFLLWRSAE